jgi:hypothetical protein
MSTIQLSGWINFKFSVTDFELAKKIDTLLRQNSRSVLQTSPQSEGNGKDQGEQSSY